MDNDQQLSMFLESLGDGVDVESAQSILAAHDWDLQAALNTVLGDVSGGASNRPRQEVLDPEGYRAPMRTGYTDTLMGPSNPAEERRMQAEAEAERRRREEEQRAQAEAQRLAAEHARHESLAQQVEQQRIESERLARERRVAKLREQQEQQRRASQAEDLLASPSQPSHAAPVEERMPQQREDDTDMLPARGNDTPRRTAEAQRLQRVSEETQVEKEALRKTKEAEDLQREKNEAEARRREAESASLPQKEVNAVVQALVALRKRYKDSDPDGLTICIQTLRAYINNLARNPHEAKYQRISCENNAFRTRIAAFEGASAVLLACGFIETSGAMVMGSDFMKTKGSRLWDALTKLDVMLDQVKAAT